MDSKKTKIDYNISSVDFYKIIKDLRDKKDSKKIRNLIDTIDKKKKNPKRYIDESDSNESKGAKDNEYNHVVNWFNAKEDKKSKDIIKRTERAEVVYNRLGTPEMYIRLAELVGVDKNIIGNLIEYVETDFPRSKNIGLKKWKAEICKYCREQIDWKMIIDSLIKKSLGNN